jgi:hypothetical protein
MLRTIYRPDSNFVNFLIPDKYIGTDLEITVFPLNEISVAKSVDTNKKRTIGILGGKASFKEIGDGKITIEEFLGL